MAYDNARALSAVMSTASMIRSIRRMPEYSENSVSLIGRLTRDPEIRSLESDDRVATFSVATINTWKDRAGEPQQRSDFHPVVIWNQALIEATGQALPFADSSFDAVLCQLGLQFFPNPGLGLKEFRRVLRGGGRAGICVISTPDRAPMWGVLADVLGHFLPEQRPIVQLFFSLADPARLERLLISAGFQEVLVERETREGSFDSFDEYWEPIEAGIGSIPQIYLTLPDAARRAVRQEVRTKLAKFESGGRLRMSVEMLIGGGRA